ncbi:MAG: WecB/TagA/CpsF family glycosyltransferase [Candidatus Helarchaeota archaeon]
MSYISILSVNIHTISYSDAVEKIINWVKKGLSRIVATANLHMIMEAHEDPSFIAILNGADLVAPDGMPLVWILRCMGVPEQERVYGPDLMLKVLDA